ncbi:hypothetical protein V501_02622 [Pseudogymnoascus sp. VKM F-4519 (FW-2642)]|nr:hypothetical protein V501_02622 [Pseudogymnoascus sp. VKM F-4519 (FW-2642)]
MSATDIDWDTLFPGVHIPQAKPDPPKVPDHLEVRFQSHPALGEVAILKGGDFFFLAVLEIPNFRANEPWEVKLCYTSQNQARKYLPLSPVQSGKVSQAIHARPQHLTRLHFDTSFSSSTSLQFSFLFRSGPNEAWRSIREEQGLEDGHVIIDTTSLSDVDPSLRAIVPDLNVAAWNIETELDQTSTLQSWILRATLPAADAESANSSFEIGTPWGAFLKWFAIVRLFPYWIAPRQGKSQFAIDKDAMLCSFLGPHGKHLVFLAVNGWNEVVSGFRSTPHGAITVHAQNNGSSESTVAIAVAAGDNFEAAVAAVMSCAKSIVNQANGDQDVVVAPLTDTTHSQGMEDWYDGLGYCTWNAFGHGVTAEKILSALSELGNNNINITNLIIDDGWQSVDKPEKRQFEQGMVEFEAQGEGFHDGLKSTVSLIRKNHPNVQHVAVWHALLGYWGGISPTGKITSKYKTVEVAREDDDPRNLPEGGIMTVVAKEDVFRFYDDFYQFLSDCGVDAVKTDAQGMIDTWISPSVRAELSPAYLDAWSQSSRHHFGIKSISCMSQTPQSLFRCYLRGDKRRNVVRNSDDFFPEVPASHPLHIWTNAHNSILTQHLDVVPDWDMFQTVNEYAEYHAAARCMSGGPIYITDIPGEHDTALIRKMTGTTPDGKTVILRLSSGGKSIQPYSTYEDDLLLKLGAYHEPLRSPVLAIFNISTRPLTELLPISSFPGVEPRQSYVVRAQSTGTISVPTEEGSYSSVFASSLDVRGYDIFTAYPLQTFADGRDGQISISNLGLLDKMTGCAGVIESSIELCSDKRLLLTTELKALGTLGVYITQLPDLIIGKTISISVFGQSLDSFSRVSAIDSRVLEVDLEVAWRQMSTIFQKKSSVQVVVSI